jgi:hypothetical protein
VAWCQSLTINAVPKGLSALHFEGETVVFIMLLEFLAAAVVLWGFVTQVAIPFFQQKPLFPGFNKPITTYEAADAAERDYKQRIRIRDLETENEQLKKNQGESKL